MPTHTGKDSKGCFAQWGGHGKKYYYECGNSSARKQAVAKADAQGHAARAAGFKENKMKKSKLNINAVWTIAYINDLPDSAFLYIEPGGKKDAQGKTTPRTLRNFPYKDKGGKVDLPHLRNALARIPQSKVSASAKSAATAKAKRLLARQTKNELQHVTINVEKENIRYDTMEGREFLVVPCVSIVEGVHNGSNGPLYYPAEELAKTPQVWNAKPVVVYHPEINGRGVSACDPVIMSSRKIGLMMNTEYSEDNQGLRHEIWIDVEQASKVDNRILDAVQNKDMLECSTGLFTDNEAVEGEWHGEPYVAIARNYRPDHLAILPDKVGACSIEDGAGFLRVNDADPEKLELSHGLIRDQINSKLRETYEDAWVDEVYDDEFIYSSNGRLYRQSYEIKKDTVKFSGLAEQVVRVIDYRPATLSGKERSSAMDEKQEIVQGLIDNELTHFTEDDREYLESQEVEVLNKMVPKEPEKKEATTPTDNEPKPEPKAEAQTKNLEQLIAEADPDTQDMIRNGVASYKAEKKRLINTITANERNTFTAEQLEAKKLDELKAICRLATPEKPVALFDGQGDTVKNTADRIGILPIPPAVVNAKNEKTS